MPWLALHVLQERIRELQAAAGKAAEASSLALNLEQQLAAVQVGLLPKRASIIHAGFAVSVLNACRMDA